MSTTGIARRIDDLGRIVLPVEMRRVFGIRPGDEIEITVDGGSIMLRKVEVRCAICDGSEGLQSFKGKQVCTDCMEGLQRSD